MTGFTPVSATAGGLLIGFSALLLLLLEGRIAGVSGILGDLLAFRRSEIAWRVAFIAGLVLTPVVYAALGGHLPPMQVTHSAALCGGFLVGSARAWAPAVPAGTGFAA